MAEIQIEKKTTSPWLWIIPILIVLALVLWWLFTRGPDRDGAVVTPAGAAGEVSAAPITDLAMLAAMSPAERAGLAGRRVELTNVPVPAVPGDETFWVGGNEAERLFVTLDPTGVPAGTESPTNVNAGQQVTVAGVLREVPADLSDMRTRWKLDDATADALGAARIYLAADRVTVTQPR